MSRRWAADFLLNYDNAISPQPGDDGGLWLDRRNQQPVQPDQVQLPGRRGRHNSAKYYSVDGQACADELGHQRRVVPVHQSQAWHRDCEQLAVDEGDVIPSIWAGEYRRAYQDDNEEQTAGGHFSFSQTHRLSRSQRPNLGTYGSAFASFLLGLPDSANRSNSQELRLRNCGFIALHSGRHQAHPKTHGQCRHSAGTYRCRSRKNNNWSFLRSQQLAIRLPERSPGSSYKIRQLHWMRRIGIGPTFTGATSGRGSALPIR